MERDEKRKMREMRKKGNGEKKERMTGRGEQKGNERSTNSERRK